MKILKLLSINLRLIKLQRFLGSLIYPLQRDRLERQLRNSKTLEASEKTGNIVRAEQTAKGDRTLPTVDGRSVASQENRLDVDGFE